MLPPVVGRLFFVRLAPPRVGFCRVVRGKGQKTLCVSIPFVFVPGECGTIYVGIVLEAAIALKNEHLTLLQPRRTCFYRRRPRAFIARVCTLLCMSSRRSPSLCGVVRNVVSVRFGTDRRLDNIGGRTLEQHLPGCICCWGARNSRASLLESMICTCFCFVGLGESQSVHGLDIWLQYINGPLRGSIPHAHNS